MRVSIVTPSFNQAEFLGRTIESVLQQDYDDLEYIVIDGGSNDGSIELLKQYDDQITFWQSQPDAGQSDAINKGMARVTGQVVSYLNSDDCLYPGAVSAIVKAFEQNPNAGVIYGATEKIDAFDRVLKSRFLTPHSYNLHKTLCLVPQPSSFYSYDAWKRCGPFDANLHFVLDWDFLLKVERHYPIVAIPDLISRFRVYETTKSSAGGWKRLEEIAKIGRKYNGIFDYNFLVYKALRLADVVERGFRLKRRPLRQIVMKAATTLKDSKTFMVHDNA